MRRPAVLLVVLAGACIPSEGPMMAPFQDCLRCHSGGGEARAWTVAGTWARGAKVSITDSAGKSFTLTGNDAGNFYTAEPLAFPLTVSVDGVPMKDSTTGETILAQKQGSRPGVSCNVCHHAATVTVGPLMAPGVDCLVCHAPGEFAATSPESTFYAAGTFPPPEWPVGTTVTVGGQSTTTNEVGNFYLTSPIGFAVPVPAEVAGSSMEDGAPYGGCNACHGDGGRAEDD